MPTTTKTVSADLQASLGAAHARAIKIEAEARAERLELERAIKLARGTSDVTEVARAVVRQAALEGAESVSKRIERVLRSEGAPLSLVDLIQEVDAPAGVVQKELQRLRSIKCPTRSTEDAPNACQVYNHGTDFEPRWAWVIGDEAPTAELSAAVEKMIAARPYTFAELTLATGARRGRLSGVLVRFQREGRQISNEGGSDRQYRWAMKPARRRSPARV